MKGLLFSLLFVAIARASRSPVLPRAGNGTNCALYTVNPGDTCRSIGKSTNATYAQLLSWNSDIDIQCSNLASLTNSTICVSNPLGNYAIPSNTQGATSIITTTAPVPTPTADQTNPRCGQYYKVGEGQDCSTITEKFSISKEDFLFLNPELFKNCTNLLYDFYYCVEPVGYISTYAGYGGTAATSTEPFNQTASTPLPDTGTQTNYTSSYPIIPIANDTRLDCYDYIWFDNITDNAAADCWSLAQTVDITAEEFILWNPSLAQNETSGSTSTVTAGNPYAYPCKLSESSSYCVALASPTSSAPAGIKTPTPRARGEVANCTYWHAPLGTWDTCENILLTYYMTIDEFYAMNPSVKSDCSGLNFGTYYCISTYPNGVPAGQPEWSATSASPISSSATTTGTGNKSVTSIPASGTATITTPSPIQTGMIATCDDFYKVDANGSCYDIAASHDIPLSSFYEWNPAVQTDCSGLQANEYVCVGTIASSTSSSPSATSSSTGIMTPTPTQTGMVDDCTRFYKVKTDDGCYDIASTEGIDLDDFYEWNPAVKNDCSGLQAKVYVCVGVAGKDSSVQATGSVS